MKDKKSLSISSSIFIYFTVTAILATIFISISMYNKFSSQFSMSMQKENANLVSQVNVSIDRYIKSIIKISDSIYYNVIKNQDLSNEEIIKKEINLLYDSNKDIIENIALFSKRGEMLLSVPAARVKGTYDIGKQIWFKETLIKNESIYFSTPHIQNSFDIDKDKYKWVITMARAIEITEKGKSKQAILLIDIDYSSIEHLLDNISFDKGSYIYLMSSDSTLIYHPKLQLIYSGIEKEDNLKVSERSDGTYIEFYSGVKRNILIKSVGYTGWRVVSIREERGFSLDSLKIKLFMIFIIAYIILMLAIINSYISKVITNPIKELDKSVNELEKGNMNSEIFIGGSYEIEHLGKSIKEMSLRIKTLMDDIVKEHEEKRKIEFDTLQSQINPHFLYNTLDIIVWMIENENKVGAVKVVTSLAKFFRISLSKGKNIISVKDELEHVKNYLMIQQMRFKNKFRYEIIYDDEILLYSSLKLMLQPIVENSIYHGMEFMDGDGLIRVEVRKNKDKLLFKISDNGFGIKEEDLVDLLDNTKEFKSKKGSGIGLKNVNERIKIYFGKEYGLNIESEADVGTTVYLLLPLREL